MKHEICLWILVGRYIIDKVTYYAWNITYNLRYYNHAHDENIWCYEEQTLHMKYYM
jgi:hypothetical protein